MILNWCNVRHMMERLAESHAPFRLLFDEIEVLPTYPVQWTSGGTGNVIGLGVSYYIEGAPASHLQSETYYDFMYDFGEGEYYCSPIGYALHDQHLSFSYGVMLLKDLTPNVDFPHREAWFRDLHTLEDLL